MEKEPCLCERVVRLVMPSSSVVWICVVCNSQFVPKAAIDYKLGSLVKTLFEMNEELGRRRDEQGTGVRYEDSVPES